MFLNLNSLYFLFVAPALHSSRTVVHVYLLGLQVVHDLNARCSLMSSLSTGTTVWRARDVVVR